MTIAGLNAAATARQLVTTAQAVLDAALAHGARVTEGGRLIDDHQVHTERLAYLATQVRAAHEQAAYAERLAAAGKGDELQDTMALIYAAEVAHALRSQIEAAWSDFGLDDAQVAPLHSAETREAVRAGLSEERIRDVGARVIAAGGANNVELEDEVAALTREMARDFGKNEVAPIAQEIHRQDLLVPDSLLAKFSEQGFFGSSIPEQYGGTGMGDLPMIVITEELSAASLAAAGSLATRPEILTKALLAGGTEEQREEWLPRIATGEVLVAIAVTEPDTGSDVASLQTRAEPAEHNGERGWRINGAKAWSTFSGRATLLALLARTDPDPKSGNRGLSLFMIEKPAYDGHHWRFEQPEGGVIAGTANPTPGYRGMHSFTLALDNVWVPHTRLVGGDEGVNRGFYLQMGGFAAGRLQTGGRAIGVAQAALEKACQYVVQRQQFGVSLADFQLTQYKIGLMATHIAAGRQLTYASARSFDTRAVEPSMAKLLTCDVAGEVSREAQLLHGGWGYSEEDPIARYVVDALVLPIFEGVKPILELKVIGRALLAGAGS
ncbi:MAG: acyl-CoA dehydrogenase family protein [Chloroflexi bacterium]|nr:acyl-CoA dehydrogenase family protein [Chloroflexota bacterium]MDA1002262.1 acyl-CoA dehydrogenase family protein [Chloroflexota bacterium]